MARWSGFVVAYRWWVIAAWVVLAGVGVVAAPRAVSALSYDFGLPGQPGYETNIAVAGRFGSGGQNAPVLLVAGGPAGTVTPATASTLVSAVGRTLPGARVVAWPQDASLLSADRRTGVVVVYPRPVPGPDAYAAALPALRQVAARATAAGPVPVSVTGVDALAAAGGGGGADVLAETLFGGIGALVVLVVVFGSALAVLPLLVAATSILTTFLIVWGLVQVTEVSFIVQYLLALIGLGVAIDYALLVVTRWREERGAGLDDTTAVHRAMATAGRSVAFSGVTVAVSLAALIALPVPFLRSVGFTGLLIPLLSVAAALSLLPALLVVVGRRLDWPHRRSTSPDSRAWHRIGAAVVRHRRVSAIAALVVLLALAAPVLGLRLGEASPDSLAAGGTGPGAAAFTRLQDAGLGTGLAQPVEVLTRDPATVRSAVTDLPGVAGTATAPSWTRNGLTVLDVWTTTDPASASGSAAVRAVRTTAEATGARVGGIPVQDEDFVTAVYGNAWWVAALIAAVTFLLLARALRSIVLPLKALALNVVSISAAYGLTVAIWQHGLGTRTLFGQAPAGAITVWVPIAVFAFLFGLSMDYEVFLLTRIREEHDAGHPTDTATVHGVARTGRLVSSAALILFLAFIALSRVPATDVKILATALALGIVLDATLVRGVLAPALVAALGSANWWWPHRYGHGPKHRRRRTPPRPDPGPAADRRPVPTPGR